MEKVQLNKALKMEEWNPLGKQEQALTQNILSKKEHFCDSKLLGDTFSWWLKTHPNLNHAVSQKRGLWKVHPILEEMGQSYLLVLEGNFAVASRTHRAVCRSCYYSVFWLPKLAPQTSFPRVRFASWKGPIQEAHFTTSAYQHHISFPNQKHFSKTLHPPDVTCGKIRKKIGKDSQRYSTFML